MSLMPSNLIAKQHNHGRTMFPNLARRLPEMNTAYAIGQRAVVCGEVDFICKSELEQANIPIIGPFESMRDRGEVPTAYFGELCMWGFVRNWYYWVAKGPGIPPDRAEELHKDYGTQCRVQGHCGCPSPLEYHHGFAVDLYHIDTQEGLNAFAELLKSIYRP